MKDGAGKCARSWSVAWICCFINFLLLGVSRLSGLLYLASISRYGVDRSRASLPFVLCYAVRNVSGPLIGYVGRRVEIRLLVACGCFLSALGAGACFFAEDITTVTVLWGGVHGLGFGLGTILLPQILNQHFDKYISNANGIAFGGECVAGFVLPVIVELFLDTYGTSGTFLIISGLILHGVPAALLLKAPETFSKTSRESKINEIEAEEQQSPGSCKCIEDCFHQIDNRSKCNIVKDESKCLNSPLSNDEFDYSKSPLPSENLIDIHSSYRNYESINNSSYSQLINNRRYSDISQSCHSDYETHLGSSDNANLDIQSKQVTKSDAAKIYSVSPTADTDLVRRPSLHSTCKNSYTEARTFTQNSTRSPSQHSCCCHESEVAKNSNICLPSENPALRQSHREPDATKLSSSNQELEATKRSSFHSFRVFLDPPFILILLTQSSMIFIFTTVMTVIVDFSRDAGVSGHQEVYVLMCLSVSDMLGRFGLGWVTDLKYMSNIAFSAVCYAGTGILMVTLVFLRGFPMTMTVAFFIGLFLGGLLIVGPGIIMDYIEEDKVTMALASRFVLFAPMSLTQSSLIGYFREKLGSYSGLFYILGFNSFLCCIFSLLVPCAAKLRSRKKK